MFASLLAVPITFGQMALTTAQIAAKVSPSVVVIQGKTDSGDVLGSGFIVSKDGKIVTNLHVIRDMKTASVHIPSRPIGRGWSINGEAVDSVFVLATDEPKDLAIIKIEGVGLPVLGLGNSDALTVGEPVVVVGSPLGLEATVTAGILSAIRDGGEGFKLLQTDAAVNPGNSGGPLVAATGLAVGVVSSIVRSDSAQGLNFAIPITYVRSLLSNLHAPISLEEMRKQLPVRARSVPAKPSPPDTSSPNQINRASLEETFRWLQERLPTLTVAQYVAPVGGDQQDITQHFQMAGDVTSCDKLLVIDATMHSRPYPALNPVHTNENFLVPLSDMRITIQTEVGPVHYPGSEALFYMVSIEASSNIIWHTPPFVYGHPSNSPEEYTNRAAVLFTDEPRALRVRDALIHATYLCKLKEPF